MYAYLHNHAAILFRISVILCFTVSRLTIKEGTYRRLRPFVPFMRVSITVVNPIISRTGIKGRHRKWKVRTPALFTRGPGTRSGGGDVINKRNRPGSIRIRFVIVLRGLMIVIDLDVP
jgi:hypothetical protein